MLEIFILSFCMSRTDDNACYTSARAYSQYSHLDKMIGEYGEKHKELLYTSMVAGTIQNKTISSPFPTSKSNFILQYNLISNPNYLIIYKKGF